MNEKKIKDIFNALDADKSGAVSKVELIRAIKSGEVPELGTIFQFPDHVRQEDGSRDDFMKFFHEIDEDDDGSISLEELIDRYRSLAVHPSSTTGGDTRKSKQPTSPPNSSTSKKPPTTQRGGSSHGAPKPSASSNKPQSDQHASAAGQRPSKFISWAFRFMDKDNSGCINKLEMVRALRENAKIAEALNLPRELSKKDGSMQEFIGLFAELDADGSGEVSRDEFIAFFEARAALKRAQHAHEKAPTSTEEDPLPDSNERIEFFEWCFNFIDIDASHTVTRTEFVSAVTQNDLIRNVCINYY